ncbi:hypothetical protein BJV82DRAFT_633843 [Fennellomyces sp. T-0311]|nr:hypothetical protein BJV82DRAFT_633843 [Fennellomyces sp. T-0311]
MPYVDDRLKPSRYAIIRWFGFDQFVPESAVTSYWVSPSVFLGIRIINTLYSTIVLWSTFGLSARSGSLEFFFAFFTNLTFIGLHAYLVTASYHHVRYFLSKRKPESFFTQPSFVNYLYYYLYHSILVFNIITPVVYWSLLAGSNENASSIRVWTNVSVHGVSLAMMMLEMIFCRIKMEINMVVLIVINVILYMLLSFVVYASNHFWVYPFLSWSQGPVAAGYYIGVGFAFVVVFFIQMLFHFIRDWVARATGRSTVHNQEHMSEMTERRETEEA